MTGGGLSRWTMAYFAAALASLLAAEALMAWGYGYPAAAPTAPATLVVVHLGAIGWLSLLMCGALFQFVPVLVNRPLASPGLVLPALLSLVAGLFSLVLGFLSLDGSIDPSIPFLPIAGPLLCLGFGMAAWAVGMTIARALPLSIPAAFVAAGLAGLAATAALGLVFTQVLGGTISKGPLVQLAARGVPIHAAAGLGGWLGMCAVGVSYRLFPMFLLAPDLGRPGTRLAFVLATIAAGTAIGGGLAAVLAGWPLSQVMSAAALAGAGAALFYGRDVVFFYRSRRRRELELNTRIAILAFASLGMSVLLPAPLAAFVGFEKAVAASAYMAAFGWLSGLGLAKLYKIVPFMTWLECYGPVLGRTPTPRVQDLVAEERALPWFLLYFVAVWAGTAALALGSAAGFQLAGAGTLVATVAVAAHLVRARLLRNVDRARRFPQGTHRPSLLYSFAAGAEYGVRH